MKRGQAAPAAIEVESELGTQNRHISLDDVQEIAEKLERFQFLESLTKEFTGKIKDIANELIEFRKDLQRKLEPGFVEMASRDIPEASNQLEGINETLEKSTMKIMDINDAQMEASGAQIAYLKSILSGNHNTGDPLQKQLEVLESIYGLSLSMLEPLSFQDLVGQRIQRIIQLVKSMEMRIEDLIISCGIKLQKHKENPRKTYDQLKKDVENFKIELKGPQREGEGLGQADIDALLNSM
jgi:chemotaxis regulatin CheY-phosphate phosphatase CheZ